MDNSKTIPRQKLIAIPNPDKTWHEKYYPTRSLANLVHPARAVFCGPPNSGKGNALLNCILRANPPFERITVCHPDADFTKEFEQLDCEMRSEIPEPEEIQGDCKELLIIDDMDLRGMSKDQKRCLSRVFGYCSTHKNLSVFLTQQDAFEIPPIVRRCSNYFVLWPCTDIDSMACLARKSGYQASDFQQLFALCTEKHDSIWIDLAGGPKLRKNCFQKISSE